MVILDNILVKSLQFFPYFIIVLQTKIYFQHKTSTKTQVPPTISLTLQLHMALKMLSTLRKGNFCNILLS